MMVVFVNVVVWLEWCCWSGVVGVVLLEFDTPM